MGTMNGIPSTLRLAWKEITPENPPGGPRTDASQNVGRCGPFLEVRRVGHRDEPGARRGRVCVPNPVRVPHDARVWEVFVDDGPMTDSSLHRCRQGEGGGDTEEGKNKSDGGYHGDGRRGGYKSC